MNIILKHLIDMLAFRFTVIFFVCLFHTHVLSQEDSDFGEEDTVVESTSRKSLFQFKYNPTQYDVEDRVPRNYWIPAGLEFTCKNRAPGYYTDPSPQSKCQAYHLCMPDGRRFTMLCGVATVFNQRTFVCDHWYNYNCSEAESDYKLNDELWEDSLLPATAPNSNRVESDA